MMLIRGGLQFLYVLVLMLGASELQAQDKKTRPQKNAKPAKAVKHAGKHSPDHVPHFLNRLLPTPVSSGFKMEGWGIRGASVIKVGSTYHMFATRYKEKTDWQKTSEIVRATSKSPLGPFDFQQVVLAGRNGKWDNRPCNPSIHKVGKHYVLFYFGNFPKTGYAIATNVSGPWKRAENPHFDLINATVWFEENKSLYITGLLKIKNRNIMVGYRAKSLAGPFVRIDKGRNMLPGSAELEDPFVWREGGRYRYLFIDWNGKATGKKQQGAYFTSKDGLKIEKAKPATGFKHEIALEGGKKLHVVSRKRPSVLLNEKGQPICFYSAVKTKDGKAWNLAQPIKLP